MLQSQVLLATINRAHRLSFRDVLFLAALMALLGSIISMTAIYHDPFAHIKLCLGGQVPAPDAGSLVLYGHCAWCYLAAALGAAGIIVPPSR